VAVEAEAIVSIIALWEAEQLELVSSFALMFEAGQIPLSERRTYILEALSKAIVRTIFDRKAIHRIGCQYQPRTG
jgi:hypothetical protein